MFNWFQSDTAYNFARGGSSASLSIVQVIRYFFFLTPKLRVRIDLPSSTHYINGWFHIVVTFKWHMQVDAWACISVFRTSDDDIYWDVLCSVSHCTGLDAVWYIVVWMLDSPSGNLGSIARGIHWPTRPNVPLSEVDKLVAFADSGWHCWRLWMQMGTVVWWSACDLRSQWRNYHILARVGIWCLRSWLVNYKMLISIYTNSWAFLFFLSLYHCYEISTK